MIDRRCYGLVIIGIIITQFTFSNWLVGCWSLSVSICDFSFSGHSSGWSLCLVIFSWFLNWLKNTTYILPSLSSQSHFSTLSSVSIERKSLQCSLLKVCQICRKFNVALQSFEISNHLSLTPALMTHFGSYPKPSTQIWQSNTLIFALGATKGNKSILIVFS